ncbi:MAG TPA: DUF1800 domain-containing protein [Dehalococcoidia bacterium]|nr:DUF1800 domain-containing protein [Dehalococcoidia bacterium]
MAQGIGEVRVSRRKLLGGAAAGAALLTAGGASAALVMRNRDGGGDNRPALDVPQAALASENPLADRDVQIRHLLRRTGFVATPAAVARYRDMPLPDVVDALLADATADDAATQSQVDAAVPDTSKPAGAVSWWLLRMAVTPRPLLERMTLFWHGLLTSGFSKTGAQGAPLLLAQNQFFRAHAFDRFEVLLKGVVRDPAMMLWLDIQTSKKGHPNENYARELMELFTLGAGNYTEQDVRESARAHTGYSLQRGRGFVFRPALHDDGEKTFLGRTGNFDADDIVDIVLQHDAAPMHFARRVFEFFAYPNPASDVLAPIAQVARDTSFDTRAVVRAVLTSDAFVSAQAYRALVSSPIEYAVGAVRLLDVQGADAQVARGLAGGTRQMGQTPFDPPNVAGWPGGRTWLGTSTWFARVNYAAALVNAAPSLDAIFAPPPASAEEAVTRAADAIVDGRIGDDARATLVQYADEEGFASLAPRTRDERLRGLVALLIASPENQLL